MSRIMKRSAAFAATAIAAVSLSIVGTGTAGAAVEWHTNGQSCFAGFNSQAHFDLGILHASEGTRNCANLRAGDGYQGRGMPNTIILGNLTLPNGKIGMAWLDDPTGFYPVR